MYDEIWVSMDIRCYSLWSVDANSVVLELWIKNGYGLSLISIEMVLMIWYSIYLIVDVGYTYRVS